MEMTNAGRDSNQFDGVERLGTSCQIGNVPAFAACIDKECLVRWFKERSAGSSLPIVFV
jgi:hypothetical protein